MTKPIKLDLSDRLQKQRFIWDQRAKSRVCVFAGYVLMLLYIHIYHTHTTYYGYEAILRC